MWNIAFSRDGYHVVTGAKNNVAHMWDTTSGAEVAQMVLQEPLNSVRFLPDSRHVLTHSGERSVILWDTVELDKVALSTRATPASDADVTAWQRALDATVKTLADVAVKHGYRAVGKFLLEDVTWTLKLGWSRVLSLTFRPFAQLRSGHVAIDEIIGFLVDEGTRQRRQRLFDWHEGIEAGVESDRERLNDVSDRLVALYEDYRDWINGSGLCAGTCTVELLITFSESFVNSFIKIGLPKELDQELLRVWRGLAAADADFCAPGREVVYISYGKRRFKRLCPG